MDVIVVVVVVTVKFNRYCKISVGYCLGLTGGVVAAVKNFPADYNTKKIAEIADKSRFLCVFRFKLSLLATDPFFNVRR